MPAELGNYGLLQPSLVRVSLPKKFRAIPIAVYLDETMIGRLKNEGESISRSVSPGTHSMRLTSGLHFTDPFTFELSDGVIVSFECVLNGVQPLGERLTPFALKRLVEFS